MKKKESNLKDNLGFLSNPIIHWHWFSVVIIGLLMHSVQCSSIPSSLELIFKDMLLESRNTLKGFAFGNELIEDLLCLYHIVLENDGRVWLGLHKNQNHCDPCDWEAKESMDLRNYREDLLSVEKESNYLSFHVLKMLALLLFLFFQYY